MFYCLLSKANPQFKGSNIEHTFVDQGELSEEIQVKSKIVIG